MQDKWRLARHFGCVGFSYAAVATLFLWWFLGRGRHVSVELGLKHESLLLTFPFIAAAFAALATLPFNVKRFGAPAGALAALVAYVAMCALVAFLGGTGWNGFQSFFILGFIFYGWTVVLVGAAVGYRHRARMRHAL